MISWSGVGQRLVRRRSGFGQELVRVWSGVGQIITLHASPTARNFTFLVSAFSVIPLHFPHTLTSYIDVLSLYSYSPYVILCG